MSANPNHSRLAGNRSRASTVWLAWLSVGALATALTLLTSCGSSPETPGKPPAAVSPTESGSVTGPVPAEKGSARSSSAATPRAYRQDAATHIYALNANRIYKGKLQPLLYAVGVLQVDIDKSGRVVKLNWMRAPRHAPEVIREIERTVRAAAPYPVPARMGKVTYTDTWLWDKSGKFQLDTLTEGQL